MSLADSLGNIRIRQNSQNNRELSLLYTQFNPNLCVFTRHSSGNSQCHYTWLQPASSRTVDLKRDPHLRHPRLCSRMLSDTPEDVGLFPGINLQTVSHKLIIKHKGEPLSILLSRLSRGSAHKASFVCPDPSRRQILSNINAPVFLKSRVCLCVARVNQESRDGQYWDICLLRCSLLSWFSFNQAIHLIVSKIVFSNSSFAANEVYK